MGRVALWVVASVLLGACNGSSNLADDDQGGITLGFRAPASDADETEGAIEIPIDLSGFADQPVTFVCEVIGGTATSADASVGCGIDLIPPGVYATEIRVFIAVDDIPEPAETFELALTNVSGARLGAARHTFTIRDNLLPRVTFARPDVAGNEGDANTVEVQLMPASSEVVSVDYTISGTATTDDYGVRAGTVVFPPGITTQLVDLQMIDDALEEDTETIVLTLTKPVNSIIGMNGTATTFIDDVDQPPHFSFASDTSAAPEGNSGTTVVSVEVRLDAPSGRTLDIPFSILPLSTALSPGDYVLQTASPLTFPPGIISRSITFEVVGDLVQDGSGTVVLELPGVQNATPSWPTHHTLSLTNDECVGTGTFRFCPDVLPTTPVTLPMYVDTRADLSPCLAQQPSGWAASGQPPACFVFGTTITVSTTKVFGARPLVLYATDAVIITGVLDAASKRAVSSGPGTQSASCAAFVAAAGPLAGGAGGTFITAGGNGGSHSSPAGSGGLAPLADPSPPLVLRGGCAGQIGSGGDAFFSPPGTGGGVVYLLAGTSITLQSGAIINASGGGGTAPGPMRGGSGGGSGGMIVLSAPTISANGSFILANGGGGSEGGDNSAAGANGSDPLEMAPLTAAPGGSGNQGGDGGDGFARGLPATSGSSTNNNNGGGGGGGGGGYIHSDGPLTGAFVSPAPS